MTAERHRVRVDHRARRIARRDLEWADLIIAMDDGHVRSLSRMLDSARLGRTVEVRKLRGFEPVFDTVERSCRQLAAHLTSPGIDSRSRADIGDTTAATRC